MTIKQLEYFMEVARSLNYSEAAKRLFISQPALSRSITALEEELGVRLFTRNKHNVALTSAGLVLASEVPRLGADLSRVVVEVQQTEEGQRGRMRLGILDGLLLPESLKQAQSYFQARLPLVEIHPVCLNMEELVQAIKEGSVDMIYSYDTDVLTDTALASVVMLEDEFCVAVSSQSKFSQMTQVSLKDLMRERILMACSENAFELHRWKEICTRIGFLPRFITVINVSTLKFCIEHNYGIALLPRNHAAFDNPGIKRLELEEHYPLFHMLKWDRTNLNPCIGMFLKEAGLLPQTTRS